MRLLLDTHVFLWCLNDSKELSQKARALIEEAEEVYISAASMWEIAIKVGLGKLKVNIESLMEAIKESGFSELSITSQHAMRLLDLPAIHNDPFDRMLVAQATSEPLRLLTADSKLKGYSSLIELI